MVMSAAASLLRASEMFMVYVIGAKSAVVVRSSGTAISGTTASDLTADETTIAPPLGPAPTAIAPELGLPQIDLSVTSRISLDSGCTAHSLAPLECKIRLRPTAYRSVAPAPQMPNNSSPEGTCCSNGSPCE